MEPHFESTERNKKKKKKPVKLEFCTQQKDISETRVKNTSSDMKAKKIHHQQAHTLRDIQNTSGRIADG